MSLILLSLPSTHMENMKPIDQMDATELKALLEEVAPKGKMLEGDTVERIVFPAQERLKLLGQGTSESLKAALLPSN